MLGCPVNDYSGKDRLTAQRPDGVYGATHQPPLPAQLRDEWRDEALPTWLAKEAGLLPGIKLQELDASVWSRPGFISNRLERYATRLLAERFNEVQHLRALKAQWPSFLNPRDVAWKTRTRNCLDRAGLLDNIPGLASVTFADLIDIPSMGANSVLDFATTAEIAIEECEVSVDQTHLLATRELLSQAQSAEWLEFVTNEDPRFSSCFDVRTSGTSLQELMDDFLSQVPLATLEAAFASPRLKRALDQLEATVRMAAEVIAQIDEMSLDDALRDYVSRLSNISDGRLDALLARLGMSGAAPTTLQTAADMTSVTRERVRQLQSKIETRRPSHPVYMPKLDIALRELITLAPVDGAKAAAHLQQLGLSKHPLDAKGVIAASTFCGREPSLDCTPSPEGYQILVEGLTEHVSKIAFTARKQTYAYGASNVAEVAATLAEEGSDLDEDIVLGVLKGATSAAFLNEDWFWMPDGKPGRNRLINVTRKILSVVSPIDVAVVREGVRRVYRVRGLPVVPPRDVLLSFYADCPEFEVKEQLVGLVHPLDYSDVLGPTERILVDVLRSSASGVLDRASFLEGCSRRGMNPNTFSVYSSYSPVVEHVGTDIWALRGVAVSPAAVEALRNANAERPRTRRAVDYGWTDSGNLWVASRLPPTESLVLPIPTAIRPYLADSRFTALAEDGSRAGTVAANADGASWGYGPYLRRRGADVGDILRVEFDLPDAVARLSLETDEVLIGETYDDALSVVDLTE